MNSKDLNTVIKINGSSISLVESTKFLGVIINQNLSWKPIDLISSKASKVIGIMCHARKYLAPNSLLTIYNSLFLPYINYCNLIWASTYSLHTQPLVKLQKKAIRIITHSPLHAHTKPLFVKTNTLPFSSIFKFQMSSFVFSHINKRLPLPLSSFLHLNLDYHEHLTRSRFNIHKTFHKQHFSLVRAQAPTI